MFGRDQQGWAASRGISDEVDDSDSAGFDPSQDSSGSEKERYIGDKNESKQLLG